jgi:hypothetical protein
MVLLGAAGLCVLMAAFNALRFKSKGIRAFYLSGAFLAVGAAILLYRAAADQTAVAAFGAVAFGFMVADFANRAKNLPSSGAKK